MQSKLPYTALVYAVSYRWWSEHPLETLPLVALQHFHDLRLPTITHITDGLVVITKAGYYKFVRFCPWRFLDLLSLL